MGASQPIYASSARSAPVALVVAQDEALRDAIASCLAELSRLMVEAVGSVAEARASVARSAPSVVVVDSGFGDLRVARLVTDLAKDSLGPAVVLLSTNERGAALARAQDVVLVQEPFEVDTLLEAIDEARAKRASTSVVRLATARAVG